MTISPPQLNATRFYPTYNMPLAVNAAQAAWQPNAVSSYVGQSTSIENLPPIQAHDPEILQALQVLSQTQNLPDDEAYLQTLGVNIIFHSGQEALNLIRRLGVTVEFGNTGDPSAHAVWVKEQNKMIVNQNYRGNMSVPVMNAIAAAIYHEAGHAARLGDNFASIQEELDCLALNTMAYRAHVAKNPNYAVAATTGPYRPLFENGVALYPKLFFDADPYKRRLVDRIIEKYGMLEPESPDHRIPMVCGTKTVTERVLYEIQRRNSRAAWAANLMPPEPAGQALTSK